MERIILLTSILFSLCSYSVNAQTKKISSKVFILDTINNKSKIADTMEAIGASVCLLKDLDSNEKGKPCAYGTFADVDGFFEIDNPDDYSYMEISFKGADLLIFNLNTEIPDSIFMFANASAAPTTIVAPFGKPVIKKMFVSKPAIYLYPTKPAEITVLHDFKGKIGTTFPDYNDGWQVTVQPNGELRNKKDNRKYEYLFWDGTYAFPKEHYDFKNGFVVNSKDNVAFLLDKLTLIGLNEKETNDFMVYWLPMLNQNPINFIHFRINDNIDNSSVLKVSPEPDSWIRLFMEFKPVDASFTIAEQQLKTYPRKGFTLVEWGGGKIEQNFVFQ